MQLFTFFIFIFQLLFWIPEALSQDQTRDEPTEDLIHALVVKDSKRLDEVLSYHPKLINQDWEGDTTLLISLLLSSSSETLKILLKHHANVEQENGSCWTPLLFALASSQREAVELLLHNGASANKKNKCGVSPLMAAVYSGDEKLVHLILQKTQDIDSKSIEIARRLNYHKILEILECRSHKNFESVCNTNAHVSSNLGYTIAEGIESKYKDILPTEYEFVTNNEISNKQGLLGKGGDGAVYLVRDKRDNSVWAAKFPRDSDDSAKVLTFSEEKLYALRWFLNFANPYDVRDFSQFSLRTYVRGKALKSWILSGDFFASDSKSKDVREKFKQMLLNMSKIGYIDDGHSKNIIFDETYQEWVFIDGGSIIKTKNIDEFVNLSSQKIINQHIDWSGKEQIKSKMIEFLKSLK